MRLENVLNSMQTPDDIVIVHVSDENILSVLATEATAVVNSPETLSNKRSIVIKCKNGIIVAVGTIKRITEYSHQSYGHIWKNIDPAWRSLIEFENVITIGCPAEEIFGADSKVKYCETVMYLKEQEDVQNLAKAVEQFYMLNIKSFLADLGYDQ